MGEQSSVTGERGGNDMSATPADMENFEFELTAELIDEIIFCMEDQNTNYVINCKTGTIVPLAGGMPKDLETGAFMNLPGWSSSDGFIMMEKFISSLHNPLYREELRSVMSRGRGVFRNFKQIVKKYEPLKKRWYTFKDRYMKDLVVAWYGVSKEAWHFEKMGKVSLETDNLILSDFTFPDNCSSQGLQSIEAEEKLIEEVFGRTSLLGRYHLERIRQLRTDPKVRILSLCAEALDGVFAGVMWGVLWSPPGDGGDLLLVKVLYVAPAFRGLGLGKTLVAKFTAKAAAEEAVERVYFEVPEGLSFIRSMLEKEEYQPVTRIYSRRLLPPYQG